MEAFQAEKTNDVAIPPLISVGSALNLHLMILFSPKDRLLNKSLSKFS